MRKRITMAVIAALCAAVLLMGGCGAVNKVKNVAGKNAELLETAYFIDEDTGIYNVVAIVENNTLNPIELGFVNAKAYDGNGERIESVKTDKGDFGLGLPFYWLCRGEKTAVVETNSGHLDDSNFGMHNHYVDTPASLEWEDGFSGPDPDLVPHGLSVVDCTPYGGGEFAATIHNGSETDYTYDADSSMYSTPDHSFRFDVVAVYRDTDGKICDAVDMMYSAYVGAEDMPAGSDTVINFYSDHVCEDDSLTPEYYICVTEFE